MDPGCSAQSVLLDCWCPVNLGTRHTTLNKASQKPFQSVWTTLERWWWIRTPKQPSALQLLTLTSGQSRAERSSQHSMPDYFLSFPMQVSYQVIPQRPTAALIYDAVRALALYTRECSCWILYSNLLRCCIKHKIQPVPVSTEHAAFCRDTKNMLHLHASFE